MPATTKRQAPARLTIRLPEDLTQTAQEAVALGLATSTVAFVEEAVRARTREVRHARMRLLAAEAVADPGFVEDMRAVASAFSPSQSDSWPEEAAGN